MDHPAAVYKLPAFLQAVGCTPAAYRRWLARKAATHFIRDRARGNAVATREEYKQAIHRAVERSCGRDEYTGHTLRWDLISRYNNAESKKRGRAYKKEFGDLPTVDHVNEGLGRADFKICSWRVNDAKHDLDHAEFLDVCNAVLAYSDRAHSA
jgi:hypothetical protein